MNTHEISSQVPGLRVIREALGLSQLRFAGVLGISQVMENQLEKGSSAGSVPSLKRMIGSFSLALSTMKVTADDFLYTPTPGRVSEIRAAWLEAEANTARLVADAAQAEVAQ
jgi:transcriptional regulator with XRE-family HTH domain